MNSADQIGQLEALRSKMKSGNYKLPNSKSRKFGKRNAGNAEGKSKGELTINMATRPGKLNSMQSGNAGLLEEPLSREFRRGSLIEGLFLYTMGNRPFSAGHKKAGAYVDENRKLDARFCVKGFQEFAGPNASAPTVQLQSIRL